MDDELPAITGSGPVVIVDDDAIEVMLFQRYLLLAGIEREIKAFNAGAAFLDYLLQVQTGEESMPAVVLLDVWMPKMSGYDILRQIRAREPFRRVPPVLMFSNSKNERDTRYAYESGANGYQIKPNNKDEYLRFFERLFAV